MPDRNDIVGAVSTAMCAELLVVITIIVSAAIGVNIGAIVEAWGIFN